LPAPSAFVAASATAAPLDTLAPSRASVTTARTAPVELTLRSPARGSLLASSTTESTQALTFAAFTVGLPSSPSTVGMLIQDALRAFDAACTSSPSSTLTGVATRPLARAATASASCVVTVGTASTKVTVVAVDERSRAAAATTSWKVAFDTVWPDTAGTTTNDFLLGASSTRASLPALPTVRTSSDTTAAVVAWSVLGTAWTSREDTSDVAYDDQDSLAANTAPTVASTSTV
jgi:hypothetical protein